MSSSVLIITEIYIYIYMCLIRFCDSEGWFRFSKVNFFFLFGWSEVCILHTTQIYLLSGSKLHEAVKGAMATFFLPMHDCKSLLLTVFLCLRRWDYEQCAKGILAVSFNSSQSILISAKAVKGSKFQSNIESLREPYEETWGLFYFRS